LSKAEQPWMALAISSKQRCPAAQSKARPLPTRESSPLKSLPIYFWQAPWSKGRPAVAQHGASVSQNDVAIRLAKSAAVGPPVRPHDPWGSAVDPPELDVDPPELDVDPPEPDVDPPEPDVDPPEPDVDVEPPELDPEPALAGSIVAVPPQATACREKNPTNTRRVNRGRARYLDKRLQFNALAADPTIPPEGGHPTESSSQSTPSLFERGQPDFTSAGLTEGMARDLFRGGAATK